MITGILRIPGIIKNSKSFFNTYLQISIINLFRLKNMHLKVNKNPGNPQEINLNPGIYILSKIVRDGNPGAGDNVDQNLLIRKQESLNNVTLLKKLHIHTETSFLNLGK